MAQEIGRNEQSMANVDTIRAIYADYRMGNIEGILGRVAENVEWEYAYEDRGIPWLAPHRGHEGVRAFFQALKVHLAFEKFEITNVLGEGSVAIALVSMEALVLTTNRRIVQREDAHVWHFDDGGRVRRFRHMADTLQHAIAFDIARLLPREY
jgi:ketosteroid isomerase-like protein